MAHAATAVVAIEVDAEAAKKVRGTAVLTWESLNVTGSSGKVPKQILKDVSGFVQPGELLAIMGPSGCGKSTLLDLLAGRINSGLTREGRVKVNGHESRLSYGKSAYVTQDEVLIGTLTVRETISYAARLRVRRDENSSTALPLDIAEAVIAELGLSDCADTQIGNWFIRGVSGGQRRRVAIGCELVVSPTILFLDEPTSGLDAAAAYHVTGVLKGLTSSRDQRTILCVIHQPSSEVFALFDRLQLLAEGQARAHVPHCQSDLVVPLPVPLNHVVVVSSACDHPSSVAAASCVPQVVYFGDASAAGAFFTAAGFACPAERSIADHLLHVINSDFGDAAQVTQDVSKLRNAYQQSPLWVEATSTIQTVTKNPGTPYKVELNSPSALHQTLVLTERALKSNWRDIGIFWMRLVMYVGLCLCIGFLYFQMEQSWKDVYSRTALLFFTCAFLTFMSIAAFPAFVEEMKVFVRERLNGYYGVGAFVVSNTLASAPFIALIAICSSASVYFIANLNGTDFSRFVYFVINLYLALTTVESLMMMIAPLIGHFLMGIAAGAGILGFFMLVCGFFQPRAQLPRPVFYYPFHFVSFHTYAFYGFMNNEFGGTNGWNCPCSSQPGGCGGPCVMDGRDVLAYWDVPDWNKWYVSCVVLAGWATFYRMMFFVTCKLKEKKSR